MVFGDKVIAAVKPEVPVEQGLFEDFEEENEPDDDCICICFCDDDEIEDEEVEDTDHSSTKLIKEDQEAVKKGKIETDNDDDDDDEEEELADPNEELKTECSQKKECASLKERLDECNARVESRSKTAETCVEEIIDFMHCVDHCASKILFSKLK